MSQLRIPSPARSQGALTPRRYNPRRGTRSVGSPARSTTDRLTAVIHFNENNKDSFALSPAPSRRSVLNDDTYVEEPRRRSWWKKLGDNSRDVMEVLNDNKILGTNEAVEEYIDIEVLSQEKKNYTIDLPDSSDSESISSIVIPQRKLFTQKDLQSQNKFGKLVGNRESLAQLHKSNIADKTVNVAPKNLFNHNNRAKTKPVFPAALLNISPEKTANKTKEMVAPEVKGQARNLFGNRGGTKRKNMFADFIVSDSEDDISEIQPKVFGFQKKDDKRRESLTSKRKRDHSPSSSIDIEMDGWQLLPSSTMVENQLEEMMVGQTLKVIEEGVGTSSCGHELEKDASKIEENIDSQNVNKDKSKSNKDTEEVHSGKEVKTHDKAEEEAENEDKMVEDDLAEEDNRVSDVHQSEDEIEDEEVPQVDSEVEPEESEKELNYEESEEDNQVDPQEEVEENENTIEKIETDATNENEMVLDSEAQELEQDQNNVKVQNESVSKDNIKTQDQGETEIETNDNDEVEQREIAQDDDKAQNLSNSGARDDEENLREVDIEIEEPNQEVNNTEAQNVSALEDEIGNHEQDVTEVETIDNEAEELNENISKDKHGNQDLGEIDTNDNEKKIQNESVLNENEDEGVSEDDMETNENEDQEEQDEIVEEAQDDEEAQNENNLEDSDSEENRSKLSNEIVESEEEENNETVQDESVLEDEPENQDQSGNEIEADVDDNEDEEEQNESGNEAVDDEEVQNESNAEENNESSLVNQDSEEESQNESEELHYESESEEPQSDTEVGQNESQTNPQDESENEIQDSNEHDEVHASSGADTPDVTHDTTGGNRRNSESNINSPEAILHDKTKQIESFTAKGRNSSIRKTTMLKNLNIRPSLAPPRESTGISDGTRNSSVEGSGWDSHRTTRKTLRQTFGRDFTPRKSLRALVMEKSAKRQTNVTDLTSVTSKFPQANSTELPEASIAVGDDEVDMECNRDVSKRTRQTTLEMYLQKIKEQNIERKLKMEEAVRNSLKAPSRDALNPFKVPAKPMFSSRKANTKAAQAKTKKSRPGKAVLIPLDNLPQEVLDDMKYKPPKRYQPSNAAWITKRLYKFLESKLEPKYDYKARVRAEKLVESIHRVCADARRQAAAPRAAVDALKAEMARLGVVVTHFDFYQFFHEYMPREIRVKVVPDVVNKIGMPKHGVFSEILRGNTVQG